MARGIWLAIVVMGMLIAGAAGALSEFNVSVAGTGTVHCDAPFYGSGHHLSGDAAKACDDEARTRAETGGLVALGIGAAGLVVGRIFKTPV